MEITKDFIEKTLKRQNGMYVFSNDTYSFNRIVLYGEILRPQIQGYECIKIEDFIKNNNITKIVFKSKL